MKTIQKLLGVILIMTLTTLADAQTEQGKLLVSGSTSLSMGGGLSNWKSDDGSGDPTHTMSFSFSPKAAYFVIDNLAVGARFPFSVSRRKDSNDNKSIETYVGFAPWVRYYFLTDKIRPFAEGSFGGGILGDKYKPDQGDTSKDNYGVFMSSLGGGVTFFFLENVAFDAGLNWALTRTKAKTDNNNNTRSIYHTINLEFGIIIILL